MPPREKFDYTFDNIARVIERFTEIIGFDRFALYVFDYGAPTGFRMAVRHPERITAIISQNGNAYEEGLSDGWTPIRAYWEDASPANRKALRDFLTPETTNWQYTHGVPDPTTRVTGRPKSSIISIWLVPAPMKSSSTSLAITRVTSRCTRHSKNYFRTHKPPFLAVWGKNDPFFLPPGAEAFKRDIPDAEVRFFDTGHFALETHHAEIAKVIGDFLDGRADK